MEGPSSCGRECGCNTTVRRSRQWHRSLKRDKMCWVSPHVVLTEPHWCRLNQHCELCGQRCRRAQLQFELPRSATIQRSPRVILPSTVTQARARGACGAASKDGQPHRTRATGSVIRGQPEDSRLHSEITFAPSTPHTNTLRQHRAKLPHTPRAWTSRRECLGSQRHHAHHSGLLVRGQVGRNRRALTITLHTTSNELSLCSHRCPTLLYPTSSSIPLRRDVCSQCSSRPDRNG